METRQLLPIGSYLFAAIFATNVLLAGAGPYSSLGGYNQPYNWEDGVRTHLHSRHKRSTPTPDDREACSGGATPPPTMVNTEAQLQQLRSAMVDSQIKAYIIPMDDAHQSEYVSEHDKRIQFISGFSGSAGTAVVLADSKAALWVDGRYFLQSEQQLDCSWTIMKMGVTSVSVTGWLKEVLQTGDKVGADPKLLSHDRWISYNSSLREGDIDLVERPDLVDGVWASIGGRPELPSNPLLILGMEFAGKSWQDKVETVRKGFNSETQQAVYTALDDIAWLVNMRGADIDFNPVFFAYAIVARDKTTLYLTSKDQRLTSDVAAHLNCRSDGTCEDQSNCVEVKSYEDFFTDMQSLRNVNGTVWVSPMSSYAVFSSLGATKEIAEEKAYLKTSLIRTLKGRKNPTEVEGLRKCHIRDSAILIEFITKLEKDIKEGTKEWDEISASDELERMRASQQYNKGLSFATISASGPNGAVIHYTASEATKRPITTSDIYLLDSGGQYLDGTTDVTRTFHFGTPTDFQKEAYTRVLMGVIDLASAIWPQGTTYGHHLEPFARRPLWAAGLNYRHGTGHGIGAYLNVHEGPGSIGSGGSKYEGLLEGEMFFSDEPGYYQDGEFGIRLETIVMTEPKNTPHRFGGSEYHGFKAFTLVPFEPNLINCDLLSAPQRRWLNEYHQKVQEEIAEKVLKPQGKTEAYEWVTARTAIIPDNPTFSGSSSNLKSTHALTIAGFLLIVISALHAKM